MDLDQFLGNSPKLMYAMTIISVSRRSKTDLSLAFFSLLLVNAFLLN